MALTTSPELNSLSDTLVAVSFTCFILAAAIALLQLVFHQVTKSDDKLIAAAVANTSILSNGSEKISVLEDADTSTPRTPNGTSPNNTYDGIPEQSFGDISMFTTSSVANTTVSSADELLLRGNSPATAASSYKDLQRRTSWLELRKSVLLRQATKLEGEVEEIAQQVRELRVEKERLKKALKGSGKELRHLRESWEDVQEEEE